MDKYNLSEVGFGVKFYPVTDRDLKVIAYAAFMFLDHNPKLSSFLDKHDEKTVDYLFKKHALELYTGKVPLILPDISETNSQFPESLVVPRGHELILTVKQTEYWQNGKVFMDNYAQLSSQGVDFAIKCFAQSYLSLPFLMKLRPKYIELSGEVADSCSDEATMSNLIKLMKPFKDMGVKSW